MSNIERRNRRREVAEFMEDPFGSARRWAPVSSMLEKFGQLTGSFDVEETEDSYVVSADLPGVEKDNVKVSLNGGVIAIKATRQSSDAAKKEMGSYSYAAYLGNVEGGAAARLQDGVLTVTVPKAKGASGEIPVE